MQIQAKQRELQELSRVCEDDRRSAQAAALKTVQEEAQLWADAQKASIRQKILEDIHAQVGWVASVFIWVVYLCRLCMVWYCHVDTYVKEQTILSSS